MWQGHGSFAATFHILRAILWRRLLRQSVSYIVLSKAPLQPPDQAAPGAAHRSRIVARPTLRAGLEIPAANLPATITRVRTRYSAAAPSSAPPPPTLPSQPRSSV